MSESATLTGRTSSLQAVLSGRTALVTGGNRGIGKAICLALAKAGAAIAVGSRSTSSAAAIKAEIEEHQVDCWAGVCDVRYEDSIASFIDDAQSRLGKVDILINNAGIYRVQAVAEHKLEIWSDVLNTNLTGALLTSKHLVQSMIEKQWGRIINISSISGQAGEINGSAYSASKFGLIGLTQSLAKEVAKFGITVNAVCPGWVLTEMSKDQLTDQTWCQEHSIDPAESIEIARLSVPQMRFIEPDEVASLVLYLCTDAARGITGQAINVCGGLSLS